MQSNAFLSKEQPLNTCKECQTQECIKTGKICKTVEKMLPKLTTGRLRGEHSFNPDILEKIAQKTAFEKRYGKAYFKGRRGEELRD